MTFKFDAFKKYQNKLNKLEKVEVENFLTSTCDELSLRLLRKVKKRTPKGVYPPSSGLQGGALQKGWEPIKAERVNGKIMGYVINDTPYAMYVEYGHRICYPAGNQIGWVDGQFMMTISADELQQDVKKIVSKKLTKFLKDSLKNDK